jgi:hypothetical protein
VIASSVCDSVSGYKKWHLLGADDVGTGVSIGRSGYNEKLSLL